MDVSLFAYGYQSENLRGSMENTAVSFHSSLKVLFAHLDLQIGTFIATVMDIDLPGTTSLLQRTSKAWHDKDAGNHLNRTVGVAHYHGMDALSHGSEHLYLDDPARHKH